MVVRAAAEAKTAKSVNVKARHDSLQNKLAAPHPPLQHAHTYLPSYLPSYLPRSLGSAITHDSHHTHDSSIDHTTCTQATS